MKGIPGDFTVRIAYLVSSGQWGTHKAKCGWFSRSKYLLPSLISCVQSLGPTQWEERSDVSELSSELHTCTICTCAHKQNKQTSKVQFNLLRWTVPEKQHPKVFSVLYTHMHTGAHIYTHTIRVIIFFSPLRRQSIIQCIPGCPRSQYIAEDELWTSDIPASTSQVPRWQDCTNKLNFM